MRKRMPVDTGRGHVPRHGWPALIPHTPPWIAWALLPALASLARLYWATSILSMILAAVGLAAVAAGLAWFAWHVYRARGRSIRLHAAASVAAAGAWLVLAFAFGFHTKLMVSVWLLGGLGVCLAWSLRRLAKSDGTDQHGDDSGRQILDAVALTGARFGRVAVDGPKVKVPIKLVRGEQTTADAQGARRRFESKLGLRPGAVRIIGNPENEAEPEMQIVAKDPLVNPVAWLGPNAPGESIAVVVEFATYDDGIRAGLWLPGQRKPPRVGAHVKIAGMTGSGKTEGGLIVCANILTRHDASLVYIDSVKGIQSIRSIINGVDLPVIDRPGALAVQKRLPTVIRARTQWLGEHGYSQWEPGCGLKFLVWWIEESADLIANSTSFTRDVEQARSAGVAIVASQQRWTHDRVDTSARANFGAGICYGVDNQDSAEAVLSEETVDAGAVPWRWKNSKPGYLHLEGPGIDSTLWPVPARSDLAEPAHLTDVVAEFGRPGLDYVTAIAIGEIYTRHTSLVAEGKAPWQTPVKTATRMPTAPVDAEVVDEDLDDEDDVEDPYEDDVPANPEPGWMDDVDPTRDIPEDDGEVIPLGEPEPQIKPGRAEAVATLETWLKERADEGHQMVHTSELVELRKRIGRSASWLSGELGRLVDEGFLEEHPDQGMYGLPVKVAA